MNILWITNLPLPPICKAIGKQIPSLGGWMYSSLKRLRQQVNDTIAVASIYSGAEMVEREIDGIKYYLLPLRGKLATSYNNHLEPLWQQIKRSVNPDVIHIHGSEYPHGLAYVNACGSAGVVVSLQGIISCYARHYASGIDYTDIKKSLTFRDFVKRSGIFKEQKEFEKRGRNEIKLLKSVKHIIGRTEWDKSHAWAINPDASYHYCGETLRDSFYLNKWDYSKCEPYSIFVSQGSYPIKGLHMLLKAMPLILRIYPNTKIYVGGTDPTSLRWYRIAGYGKYLKKLIKKLQLSGKIKFLGMLNEEEMCERYLLSNVFVCPSSIENSPNSLGEAQMLEMPHIASFVGGIPEIVNYNKDILYRFDEFEMLAKRVCKIFEIAKNFIPSEFDKLRYSGDNNAIHLMSVYKAISAVNKI